MDLDKFLPRDEKGVRVDVRGNRDLVFNDWHRDNTGRTCYVTDVDFLEYRFENGKLVLKAIFEAKEWHLTAPKYLEECANFKAIKELCRLANIPFYIILYLKDEITGKIIKFRTWDVFKRPNKEWEEHTPETMKKMIESL